MPVRVIERKKILKTPWLSVVAKRVSGWTDPKPYYSIALHDYVTIVALTPKKEMLLIRQYRPAVEAFTWEFPSGLIEKGESALKTAARELTEETGYSAKKFVFLGRLWSDTGRHSNQIWCYAALDAVPAGKRSRPEKGVSVRKLGQAAFWREIRSHRFKHALNLGALALVLACDILSPYGKKR